MIGLQAPSASKAKGHCIPNLHFGPIHVQTLDKMLFSGLAVLDALGGSGPRKKSQPPCPFVHVEYVRVGFAFRLVTTCFHFKEIP